MFWKGSNAMELHQLLQEAKERIALVSTQAELGDVRAFYLGKKSPLQDYMKQMASLTPEERKTLGAQINAFKSELEDLVNQKRQALLDMEIEARLKKETVDVTLPGYVFPVGTMHPLKQMIRRVEDIFMSMGYSIKEGPEIETDRFNFEMLNVPKGHPARDMQDTFYITENLLLRTQTSPVQVRTLLEAKGEPVKILCPGKVYRRDDDDATHSHQFMQFEGLVVGPDITMSDLKGTLSLFIKKLFGPAREIRFKPSYFPFTEPSVEVDVSCFKCGGKGCPMCKQTGWIEILGAGMVHPNVLRAAGYDPEKMQGFAFGIGIERVTMLAQEIDDIRHFYLNDKRFLQQFERGNK